GIEQYDRYSKELVFVATGTGISPFHSIVRSYPGIKFTLYHGVCFAAEAYERDEYDASRYFLCTSKEKSENGIGRVTKYLGKAQIRTDALYLLCGNSNMIYDVFHILKDKGVPAENIFSEIYF
ncbi:MAG TPA: hypothetical protein VHO46_11990, partial [Bacteroidales bacterium]|nr:hypothetical protein [Bacteroidales bacterium]